MAIDHKIMRSSLNY